MSTSYTVYGCPACGSTHPAGTVRNMLRQIVQGYARDMIEFDEERMRDIARSVFLESGENRVERVREIALDVFKQAQEPTRPAEESVAVEEWYQKCREKDRAEKDRDTLRAHLAAAEKERDMARDANEEFLGQATMHAKERDSALAKLAAAEKDNDELRDQLDDSKSWARVNSAERKRDALLKERDAERNRAEAWKALHEKAGEQRGQAIDQAEALRSQLAASEKALDEINAVLSEWADESVDAQSVERITLALAKTGRQP